MCDFTSCPGCCSGSACELGTDDSACGTGGVNCQPCTSPATCGGQGQPGVCAEPLFEWSCSQFLCEVDDGGTAQFVGSVAYTTCEGDVTTSDNDCIPACAQGFGITTAGCGPASVECQETPSTCSPAGQITILSAIPCGEDGGGC